MTKIFHLLLLKFHATRVHITDYITHISNYSGEHKYTDKKRQTRENIFLESKIKARRLKIKHSCQDYVITITILSWHYIPYKTLDVYA